MFQYAPPPGHVSEPLAEPGKKVSSLVLEGVVLFAVIRRRVLCQNVVWRV